MSSRRTIVAGAVAAAALPAAVLSLRGCGGPGDFASRTSGRDRLVTNEYAHWNPRASDARRSPDWDVTSGSLFVRDGAGWSGPPDQAVPDARSSTGTGSSVFRMNTRRADFEDVRVTLRVRVLRLVPGGGRAPTEPTDGLHLMLRRQDQTELYVASLARRDGLLVVKKKLTGGTENGGTYTTLGQVRHPFRPGAWQSFDVRITSNGRSLVTIAVRQDGRVLLEAVDGGRHGPPIVRPGSIGLRADNCEFAFTDLRAHPLG
ncbi:hypothetical protein F8568_010160 [Actinomadura sp. LD22]|uniref:DUF1080 domain-containing protein n=1 Tax=Actinomadura physcomitrii TaxID=2650748 RepID=A0A6I4M8Z3_9ACTN|nr:hypothetical protein [Actinomadura physcomitrii]MWA00734.1 hypothetical protein [Actinomadura physcomitrii]